MARAQVEGLMSDWGLATDLEITVTYGTSEIGNVQTSALATGEESF
jgi:hypothetical protein